LANKRGLDRVDCSPNILDFGRLTNSGSKSFSGKNKGIMLDAFISNMLVFAVFS